MQDAFWGTEKESICFLLFSQGEDSSLASQVKGKAREEVILNYFLASTSYDQAKIPFYAGNKELKTFIFKQNQLIMKK